MFAGSNFLEKNLGEVSSWIERVLWEEETVNLKGLLQSIEPKAKLLSLLALLLFALLSRNIWAIISVYGLSLLFALASRINIISFLKRVWFFIPLFTLVIVIPALFLTPGKPFLSFGRFTITRQGLLGAIFLISRVATSVSISTLLILTTRWYKLLYALRSLKVPSFIILALAMCYRYIFVLVRLFNNFLLGRKSRLSAFVPWKDNLWFLGRTSGVIFLRSLKLAEDVYLAMTSRGFDGEIKITSSKSLRGIDYGWMVFVFTFIGVLIWKG